MSEYMTAAMMVGIKQPLEFRKVPIPVPGPGKVLIKIEVCGLCHSDLHFWMGDHPMPRDLPATLGHEGIGRVVEVGPGAIQTEFFDQNAWSGKSVGGKPTSPIRVAHLTDVPPPVHGQLLVSDKRFGRLIPSACWLFFHLQLKGSGHGLTQNITPSIRNHEPYLDRYHRAGRRSRPHRPPSSFPYEWRTSPARSACPFHRPMCVYATMTAMTSHWENSARFASAALRSWRGTGKNRRKRQKSCFRVAGSGAAILAAWMKKVSFI